MNESNTTTILIRGRCGWYAILLEAHDNRSRANWILWRYVMQADKKQLTQLLHVKNQSQRTGYREMQHARCSTIRNYTACMHLHQNLD